MESKKWLVMGVLVGLVAMAFSACGKICTFGQGDCEQNLNSTTLALTVSSATVAHTSGTVTFTASGGSGTYSTYSVFAGGGTLSASSGASTVYTAPTTTGNACVRVTDSNSATADRCVTVQ